MGFKIDLTVDITDDIIEEINSVLDNYIEAFPKYSYKEDVEFNSENLQTFFEQNDDTMIELIEAGASGDIHINPYVEYFLIAEIIEKEEVVKCGDYTWFKITDIEEVVQEGVAMQNAAQDVEYANMLSGMYTLYYLKDEEMNTVVNAGYIKNPDEHVNVPLMTSFIAVGLGNEPVSSKYKDAVDCLQKTLEINEHVNYKTEKENSTVVDFEDGFKWVTINDVEDLIVVGEQMQNALMNRQFSIEYSGQMNLYFLKNKDDQVIINASFYKENNKMHMVKEKYNGCPDVLMKPYVDKLYDFLDISEEAIDVPYKEEDMDDSVIH